MLTYSDQYLVKTISDRGNSVRIMFKSFMISKYDKITAAVTDPEFAKSVSGTIRMKGFTVTIGDFETALGFQPSLMGVLDPRSG